MINLLSLCHAPPTCCGLNMAILRDIFNTGIKFCYKCTYVELKQKVFVISLYFIYFKEFYLKTYWLHIRIFVTESVRYKILCWRPPWRLPCRDRNMWQTHSKVTNDCCFAIVGFNTVINQPRNKMYRRIKHSIINIVRVNLGIKPLLTKFDIALD
jgi:hypothetical protein